MNGKKKSFQQSTIVGIMFRQRIQPKRSSRINNGLCENLNNRIARRFVNTVKQEALDELLQRRASNGGNHVYGDVKEIAEKYQANGYMYITQDHLQYRLREIKKSKCTTNTIPVTEVAFNEEVPSEVSEMLSNPVGVEDQINGENSLQVQGGRKKGSSSSAKQIKNQKVSAALTEASFRYHVEKMKWKAERKNVPNGCLRTIVHAVEDEFELEKGSIPIETVRSRVKIGLKALDGNQLSKQSPLHGVEPINSRVLRENGKNGNSSDPMPSY